MSTHSWPPHIGGTACPAQRITKFSPHQNSLSLDPEATHARRNQSRPGTRDPGPAVPRGRPPPASVGTQLGPGNDDNKPQIGNHRPRAEGRPPHKYHRPRPTSSVLGIRLSPLLAGLGPPSARPRPGPDGSCPRRPNSARTTSRPVTRISRGTGDLPPTPYHVLGTRRTQLSTRTTPSPDTAGPTGKSGDSDTTTNSRCYNVRPTGPWK